MVCRKMSARVELLEVGPDLNRGTWVFRPGGGHSQGPLRVTPGSQPHEELCAREEHVGAGEARGGAAQLRHREAELPLEDAADVAAVLVPVLGARAADEGGAVMGHGAVSSWQGEVSQGWRRKSWDSREEKQRLST